MNEELKIAMQGLLDILSDSKDFVMEQVPDVIIQMVAFKCFMSWFYVGFGLSIGVIGVIIGYLMWKKLETNDKPFSIIPSVAGITFCSFFFFHNIPTAIMTTWYPKWFIVTELNKLF